MNVKRPRYKNCEGRGLGRVCGWLADWTICIWELQFVAGAIDDTALSLLQSILLYNPGKRAKPSVCLQHSTFDLLRSVSALPFHFVVPFIRCLLQESPPIRSNGRPIILDRSWGNDAARQFTIRKDHKVQTSWFDSIHSLTWFTFEPLIIPILPNNIPQSEKGGDLFIKELHFAIRRAFPLLILYLCHRYYQAETKGATNYFTLLLCHNVHCHAASQSIKSSFDIKSSIPRSFSTFLFHFPSPFLPFSSHCNSFCLCFSDLCEWTDFHLYLIE